MAEEGVPPPSGLRVEQWAVSQWNAKWLCFDGPLVRLFEKEPTVAGGGAPPLFEADMSCPGARATRDAKQPAVCLLDGGGKLIRLKFGSAADCARFLAATSVGASQPLAFDPKEFPRVIGRYRVAHCPLGVGGFGVTKKAVDAETGERLCCKMAKRGAGDGAAQRREIELQACLRHPNVIELKDLALHRTAAAGAGKVCMILELMEGGEVFEDVMAERGFAEDRARQLFRGMLLGVAYCHKRRLCHRDIKLENLLLSADKQTVKIADFGMAKSLFVEEARTVCGTGKYVAPEQLKGQDYDGYKADIWQCGVCLYCMTEMRFPFSACGPGGVGGFEQHKATAANLKSMRALLGEEYKLRKSYTPQYTRFLARLLCKDPAGRYTAAEALQDEWMLMGPDPWSAEYVQSELERMDASPVDDAPPSLTTPEWVKWVQETLMKKDADAQPGLDPDLEPQPKPEQPPEPAPEGSLEDDSDEEVEINVDCIVVGFHNPPNAKGEKKKLGIKWDERIWPAIDQLVPGSMAANEPELCLGPRLELVAVQGQSTAGMCKADAGRLLDAAADISDNLALVFQFPQTPQAAVNAFLSQPAGVSRRWLEKAGGGVLKAGWLLRQKLSPSSFLGRSVPQLDRQYVLMWPLLPFDDSESFGGGGNRWLFCFDEEAGTACLRPSEIFRCGQMQFDLEDGHTTAASGQRMSTIELEAQAIPLRARQPSGGSGALGLLGRAFSTSRSEGPKKLIFTSPKEDTVTQWRETLRDIQPRNLVTDIDEHPTIGKHGDSAETFRALQEQIQKEPVTVWKWVADDRSGKPYSPEICARLEAAFQSGDRAVVDVGHGREVDLERMVQQRRDETWRWRHVTREKLRPEDAPAPTPEPEAVLGEQHRLSSPQRISGTPRNSRIFSPRSTHLCQRDVDVMDVPTGGACISKLYENEEVEILEPPSGPDDSQMVRCVRGWVDKSALTKREDCEGAGEVIGGAPSVAALIPELLTATPAILQRLRAVGGGTMLEGWLRSERLGFGGRATDDWEHWFCVIWPRFPDTPFQQRFLVCFHAVSPPGHVYRVLALLAHLLSM
jgi:serine/threonine-protein kinase SRK2